MVPQQFRESPRWRLATNDNETIVEDDFDTEAHRLATNDNESTVELARRVTLEDGDGDADADDQPTPSGARRLLRR
jgi:hypothetical protein